MPRFVATQAENDTNIAFSQNLSKLIKQRGLNQFRLAKEVGITHGAVQNYLKGRIPRIEILWSLAKFFGVSATDLLKPMQAEAIQTVAEVPQIAPNLNEHDSAKAKALVEIFELSKVNDDELIELFEHFTGLRTHVNHRFRKFHSLISGALIEEMRRRFKIAKK